MGERLDRALDLLERLVSAAERAASALEQRDTKPAKRERHRPPPLSDELAEARARKALERLGLG